jgi:hypothetical protein
VGAKPPPPPPHTCRCVHRIGTLLRTHTNHYDDHDTEPHLRGPLTRRDAGSGCIHCCCCGLCCLLHTTAVATASIVLNTTLTAPFPCTRAHRQVPRRPAAQVRTPQTTAHTMRSLSRARPTAQVFRSTSLSTSRRTRTLSRASRSTTVCTEQPPANSVCRAQQIAQPGPRSGTRVGIKEVGGAMPPRRPRIFQATSAFVS